MEAIMSVTESIQSISWAQIDDTFLIVFYCFLNLTKFLVA